MNSAPKTALYAGSFDPVTRGHLHVVMQALERGYASRVVVAVVDSDNKEHLLTRGNATRLFQLALPPSERNRVVIEALSSRAAIDKYNASFRIKGVCSADDVQYEAENIGAAMQSAEQRNETSLEVLWITSSPNDTGGEQISSTRGRAAFLKDPVDMDEMRKVFPEQVVEVLCLAKRFMPTDIDVASEEFRVAFNRELGRILNQPPQITVQIQRSSGHLYKISKAILDRVFAPDVFDPDGTRTNVMCFPDGTNVWPRVDRIRDCITAVAQDVADWAIVSDAALHSWRRTAGQVTTDAFYSDVEVKEVMNLGPAGCKWMMLLPNEKKHEHWADLLFSDKRTTIVTSSKGELANFLKRRGFSIDKLLPNQIIEHKGSTERFARDWITRNKHPVVLFDVIATGNTAFKHRFTPVLETTHNFSVEEHSVLLVARAGAKGEVTKSDAFSAAVAKNQFAINRALIQDYIDKLTAFGEVAPSADAKAFVERRLEQIKALAQDGPVL